MVITNTFGQSLKVRCNRVRLQALHSELELESSSWVSSQVSSPNEFFTISKERVERHLFVTFGNFGKRPLPKPRKNDGNFREKNTQKVWKKLKKLKISTRKTQNFESGFESERVFCNLFKYNK